MAFMSGMTDEELAQQGQQPQTSSASGGVLAGNSSTGPTGAATNSGSGYTNLDKYLNANAGQASGLADTVTKTAQGQVDNARNQFKSYSDSVKQDADANNGNAQAQSFVSGIQNDPSKVDSGAFKSFTGGSFGAKPAANAYSGFGDTSAAFDKAANTVNTVDDRGGQKAVLKDSFTGDKLQPGQQYTNGMANLDSFILGGEAGAKDKVQGFKSANSGLQNEFNQGVSGLDTYLGNSAQTFANNQAAAKSAAQNAQSALGRDVYGRSIAFGGMGANLNNFASADQRARMEALSQLTGEGYNWGGSGNTSNGPVQSFRTAGFGAATPESIAAANRKAAAQAAPTKSGVSRYNNQEQLS